MKCPVCNIDLLLSDRQGIEIDYCPTCRGIWLDRGELDKLIEKSNTGQARDQVESPDRHAGHDYHQGHKQHRKKSFLENIFD